MQKQFNVYTKEDFDEEQRISAKVARLKAGHNKLDLFNIETVRKVSELSSRILDLSAEKDSISQSDLQGAIDAVIIDAMQYGVNAKTK